MYKNIHLQKHTHYSQTLIFKSLFKKPSYLGMANCQHVAMLATSPHGPGEHYTTHISETNKLTDDGPMDGRTGSATGGAGALCAGAQPAELA
ncbi:unnamed protein product [Colias eurytheme]|nr:unnamed protein product [Colias eurytheme]